MRQGLILTGLGIAVWGAATLFFRLFGDWVLGEVGGSQFGSSLFLLELLALLVLIGLALVVRLRLFPEKGSATRFGYIATAVGLLFDTLTVWRRDSVFPAFSEGQHHAYSVCITLAYALTLIVPAIVDRLIREPGRDAADAHPPAPAAASDLDAPEPSAGTLAEQGAETQEKPN